MHQITRVSFSRFKAFESFKIDLRHFNVLVGPNNAGKSTILAAFRILASAMRRAASKNPSSVRGPHGQTTGWDVDLKSISVAEENLFYNYDETIPASVEFLLSNRNTLTLYFSRAQSCVLVVDAQGREIFNTKSFKQHFDCPIVLCRSSDLSSTMSLCIKPKPRGLPYSITARPGIFEIYGFTIPLISRNSGPRFNKPGLGWTSFLRR
jgi:energy-coupling factor transporter ATP-binding protein EcfA2